MKKTVIILVTLLGVFYACKKEDKTTEPTPVTISNPTCTTCPYCGITGSVTDTVIHMKATIDDTITFIASELHDTIIEGIGAYYDEFITGKNTFVTGSPEIKLHYHSTGSANIGANQDIKDSVAQFSMSYKINNVTFHSRKGIINLRAWVYKQMPPTYYHYLSNATSNFCFNTDTINGVSHKIKLGSFKVKHP